MTESTLPAVVQRFLRYVQIDTTSDAESATTPSTEKQKDLGRLLAQELRSMAADDVEMDGFGYVFASLPASAGAEGLAPLALLAHVDTSPQESGTGVRPIVHPPYAGGVLRLSERSEVTLDPARSPALAEHLGQRLITSDGTTLLGSDDKAGVALIMQLAEDLLRDPQRPRPPLRICFTVDEEIGRGVDKLDLDRLGARLAYTLDGGAVGSLEAETFNAARARLIIDGVNVHPGYAKGVMSNAVRIAAEVAAALPAAESPETTEGEEGYLYPYELTGDTGRAELKVLLRDFDDSGLLRRKRLLEAVVEAARWRHPRAVLSLAIEDQYKNMRSYIEAADRRVLDHAVAAGEAIGLPIETHRIRGGTDGARLSELGIPTPNLFTGGHDFHSLFEWNSVENLEKALEFLGAVVRSWAQP